MSTSYPKYTDFLTTLDLDARGFHVVVLLLRNKTSQTTQRLGGYGSREQAEHAQALLMSGLRETLARWGEVDDGHVAVTFKGADWSAREQWPGYQRAKRRIEMMPRRRDELS